MTENAENKPVALYVSNASVSHKELGKLVHGYNFVDSDTANKWLKVSSKIRIASPEEVAVAYGV